MDANKLLVAAKNAVIEATNNPLVIVDMGNGYQREIDGGWYGLEGFDEQVTYGNGVWTVASNGDAEDFTDADSASAALAYQWELQLARRTEVL